MINTKLNKSDYLMLALYFVFYVLAESYDHTVNFNQIDYTFINPDGSSYSQINTSPSLAGYLIGIPISFISTLSIVFIFFRWLIPQHLIKTKNYVVFAALGILALAIFGILRFTVWNWAENVPWEVYPSAFQTFMNGLNTSASNAGLPLGILLTKKYFEAQIQIADVQKRQKESELKLLQAQINPHFLFNNLNTLDALIDSKPAQAKRYIAHLSALYRYLISTKDKELVPLQEELAMIKNYFYLIETRFGAIYTFSIVDNNELNEQYLPVGALQILIENVVKHNLVSTEKTVSTTITIDNQQVIVTNNKTEALEKQESFGTGLENLAARYGLLFDKEIKITNTEFEFHVAIPLLELIS